LDERLFSESANLHHQLSQQISQQNYHSFKQAIPLLHQNKEDRDKSDSENEIIENILHPYHCDFTHDESTKFNKLDAYLEHKESE